MEHFSILKYLNSFKDHESLGSLPFYKNQNQTFSYRDLIHSAINKARELKKLDDDFFALKMDSSYQVFTHLLAGMMSSKRMLILSNKEPEQAVANYQKNIKFSRVLNDESLLNNSSISVPKIEINPETPIFYILSSGSSGPSKAIALTLKNVYSSSDSLIHFFRMNANDVTFLNLPHHHIGGLMILWRAFFSQSSVTTNESDDYQYLSLVPLQLKRFLDDSAKIEKLKKCKGILIGGAPLSSDLKQKAEDLNISIFETYGMSETCSLVTLNGKPLKNQELKLDADGHFLIKGPTLSPSVKLDSEGFFHTKDVGIKNTDSSFSFKYRSDILFKSAGEMIDPILIESYVKNIPGITEAIITPVNHPEWTNASALVYKTNIPEVTPEHIKEALKKDLHPHLIPKYFFPATKDLIHEGMKPKRFEISQFAQENYFKSLFHYLHIKNSDSKKIMVFFHGFMEDHTDLIPLMDNHKEMSFLFIDLPGHGKSTKLDFKSRDHLFSELTNLIKFIQKDQELLLYGYSMGGRVAIEVASELKPDILFLESAHFGLNNSLEKKTRLEADQKLFSNTSDLKAFFENWYKNPIFGNYNKSPIYLKEIEKKYDHNPNLWQKSLDFFSPGSSPYLLPDMLLKLKDQTIVGIYGEEDEKYKDHFIESKKSLPKLSLDEIKNSGHNPHKTHLQEVKNILKSFI